MIAPQIKTRPTCIVCNSPALGRVCYLGNHDNIVFNSWCSTHEYIIYKETVRLLEKKYEFRKGEWVVIQRWLPSETLPDIPANDKELYRLGIRRQKLYD